MNHFSKKKKRIQIFFRNLWYSCTKIRKHCQFLLTGNIYRDCKMIYNRYWNFRKIKLKKVFFPKFRALIWSSSNVLTLWLAVQHWIHTTQFESVYILNTQNVMLIYFCVCYAVVDWVSTPYIIVNSQSHKHICLLV